MKGVDGWVTSAHPPKEVFPDVAFKKHYRSIMRSEQLKIENGLEVQRNSAKQIRTT